MSKAGILLVVARDMLNDLGQLLLALRRRRLVAAESNRH
jgi:hypothetical protein